MGELKWYKRDPDAALSGMMGLSLEVRGAYNTVLDLIYTRDGILPDDDRFISGWLGVDVRVWKRIKGQLIDLGKLYLDNGNIRNRRADVEVDRGLSRVASARDAGKASGISRGHKSNTIRRKNNDLDRADVQTENERTLELPTTTPRKEEEPKGSPSPPTPKAKRGIRKAGNDAPLPDDWKPVLGEKSAAMVKLWPHGALGREEDAFRYHAAAHERLAKNWNAAFAMWLTKADERIMRNGSRNNQSPRDNRDGTFKTLERQLFGDRPEQPSGEAGRFDAGDGGGNGVIPLARARPV